MKTDKENSGMILSILDQFALDSEPEIWEAFGDGHINSTFRVTCKGGQRFILQRISERLTDRPDRLMENIVMVTEHLRCHEKDPRKVLSLVYTKEGMSFLQGCREDDLVRVDQESRTLTESQEEAQYEFLQCGAVDQESHTLAGSQGTQVLGGSPAQSGDEKSCRDQAPGESPETASCIGSSSFAGAWRIYQYVEDTLCLQAPRNEEDFYKSALAFGRFEQLLKDFPADRLFEPIPDFHNTPVRYAQLHRAIREDRAGRAGQVQEEIRFVLEREEEMGTLVRLAGAGKLPLRVTHNDTKLNNVLFDRETMEPLCVIDLDTVMPGLSLYDFGDAIRFGAATAPEDEKDLSRVTIDLNMYRAFREGFREACPDLTPLERELLPLGAKVITTEQAVRFLADYLNGDLYYHTSYPGQNLDRTRTQIKLVRDMEARWGEMD